MLFKNILVPHDGSETSNRAYKVALDMAQKYNSQITVVTCIEGTSENHWFYDYRLNETVIKKQRDAVEKYFSKLRDLAERNNVKVKYKILETPSIVSELTKFSKSAKIDLIVMGSHGRKGLNRLLLGSVANGVAQHVRCPVLIVK